LLKGLGLDANLAEVRIASKNASIARTAFEADVSNLVTEVEEAYFDAVLAAENARVARESLALAQRLYDENKRREELGTLAGSDIFQAQAELAARREALYDAERACGDSLNALRLLIAEDRASAVAMPLDLATLPATEEVRVDATKDLTRALEARPDYRQAVLGLKRDQIDALRASNAALPQLDAFARGYWEGMGSDLGKSWTGARGDDKPDYSAGLSLTYAIPNRTARATNAIAKRQTRIATLTLAGLEKQIAVELDNGARRIVCGWKRIGTARESRMLAEKSLAAEQKLYESDKSSTFVVLRLQTDLMNAQLRELVAENDYRKAIVEYQRALGMTLLDNALVLPQAE
jgi:outer membrane protein TolC